MKLTYNISKYFTEEQLSIIEGYERRRYEDILKYHYETIEIANKALDLLTQLPDCAKPEKRVEVQPGKQESPQAKETLTKAKKRVHEYLYSANSIKVRRNPDIQAGDHCAELRHFTINKDVSCDSEDFNWNTDSEDYFEYPHAKKHCKPKPDTDNIKPKLNLVKKKILPNRKCANQHSYEEEEVDDDAYVYCEDCQLEYPDDCYLHPLLIINDTQIPVGEHERAKKTLPQGLSVSKSKIKGAGLGVWTDVKIDKFTRFGPYEGASKPCKDLKTDGVSGYGWLVTSSKSHSFYIDGEDVVKSNWMRYVNCARNKREQNLEAFQYKGKIYYKTLVDINIGNELLVWYGDDYAADLGIKKDETKIPVQDEKTKKKENRDGHQCKICRAKFVNSSSYKRHKRWHIDKSDRIITEEETNKTRKFECKFCGIACSTTQSLLSHITTHTGEKPCKSSQQNNLSNYVSAHTGEKPYKCSQCDAGFNVLSALTRHKMIHTGEKPYKCSQCDAGFNQRSHLNRHMRTHTVEKLYKCSQCDAGFNQHSHLNRHLRTHTGEKPHKCSQCDARFNVLSALTRHRRTHTGEKPYKCSLCEATFNQRSHLNRHLRTHTIEMQRINSPCKDKFCQSPSIENHNRRHEKTNISDMDSNFCLQFLNET